MRQHPPYKQPEEIASSTACRVPGLALPTLAKWACHSRRIEGFTTGTIVGVLAAADDNSRVVFTLVLPSIHNCTEGVWVAESIRVVSYSLHTLIHCYTCVHFRVRKANNANNLPQSAPLRNPSKIIFQSSVEHVKIHISVKIQFLHIRIHRESGSEWPVVWQRKVRPTSRTAETLQRDLAMFPTLAPSDDRPRVVRQDREPHDCVRIMRIDCIVLIYSRKQEAIEQLNFPSPDPEQKLAQGRSYA